MKRFCPGFTLIELLVTASIMIIIFIVGIASYTQFNRGQILNQAGLELKNNLRLAQSRASAGEKPATGCDTLEGYRVTFSTATDNDFYTIQAKCSNGLAGDQGRFDLPTVVRFQPLPSPVLFKALAGGVDGAGAIILSSFGTTRTVTVTGVGEVK